MAPDYLVAPSHTYDAYESAAHYGLQGFPPVRAEARRLMTALQNSGVFGPGMTVLDLGCGPGFFLKEAATISSSGQHFGVDGSKPMVDHAIRHVHSPGNAVAPKIRKADIREPSQLRAALQRSADATYKFDLIVCTNVLSHIDPHTHQQLITGWAEHLNPGGHMLVSRPYYSDVTRGRVFGGGRTHTHAPIPGLCVAFDTTNDGAPQEPLFVVRLGDASAQKASDAQLTALLSGATASWGGGEVQMLGDVFSSDATDVDVQGSIMGPVKSVIQGNSRFRAKELDWPILQNCLALVGVANESQYIQERVVLGLHAKGRMPAVSGRLAMMTMSVSSIAIIQKKDQSVSQGPVGGPGVHGTSDGG